MFELPANYVHNHAASREMRQKCESFDDLSFAATAALLAPIRPLLRVGKTALRTSIGAGSLC
jgi:hypothetical protein